jgi:hypothetical protein
MVMQICCIHPLLASARRAKTCDTMLIAGVARRKGDTPQKAKERRGKFDDGSDSCADIDTFACTSGSSSGGGSSTNGSSINGTGTGTSNGGGNGGGNNRR